MTGAHFEKSIQNSPFEYPNKYWELDENRLPTNTLIERRHPARLRREPSSPRLSAEKKLTKADKGAVFHEERPDAMFIRPEFRTLPCFDLVARRIAAHAHVDHRLLLQLRTTRHQADEGRPRRKPRSTEKPDPSPQSQLAPVGGTNGRIAVKVISHLGDEVMKILRGAAHA